MIVGCDYSTKFIHLAWYEPIDGWQVPRIAVDPDLGQFLYDLEVALPDPVGGKLILERPWFRYNAQTAMLMQRVSTIVDVVATQKGFETHWVPIATWRSKIFGKGKYDTKTAKKLAIEHAKKFSNLSVDDNTADAICLATYGGEL